MVWGGGWEGKLKAAGFPGNAACVSVRWEVGEEVVEKVGLFVCAGSCVNNK